MGDVHPRGNPHLHWDPSNIRAVARVLAQRLGQIDPGGAQEYSGRLADFEQRWNRILHDGVLKDSALPGAKLEPKPGAFAELAAQAQAAGTGELGCSNHPDNQFLVNIRGDGTYEACAADDIPLSQDPDRPGTRCGRCTIVNSGDCQ